MTTLVRYKDCIATDSLYLTIIGSNIGNIEGPGKYYMHPTKKAIIAICGGFSTKGIYDAYMADINQAIIDLQTYPDTTPAFKTIINMFSDEEFKKVANNNQVPSLMIITSELTCCVNLYDDAPEKPVITVFPANTLVAMGTGSDAFFPLRDEIKSMQDIISVMQLAIMGDNLSGGKIYVSDIKGLLPL